MRGLTSHTRFLLAISAFACVTATPAAAQGDGEEQDAQENKALGNLVISGFIRLDTVYKDGRVNGNTAPRFAVIEPPEAQGDAQFDVTVQYSRINLAWDGPSGTAEGIGAWMMSAVAETDIVTLNESFDFNNNAIRFRKLYFAFDFADKRLKAQIGQDWDIFSPLNPPTLNFIGNYWFGGNAGWWRPQLALHKWLGENDQFKLIGAMLASIGTTVESGGQEINTGVSSGEPVWQGQFDWSFAMGQRKGRLGISGVWGKEKVSGVFDDIRQEGISAHVVLPISDTLSVMGEVQTGKNTDAFLMGGGFNLDTGEEIESTSGWAAVTFTPGAWRFDLLFGREELEKDHLDDGQRYWNTVYGLSSKWTPFKQFTLGLEYTHFDTRYLNSSNPNVNMFWLSFYYNFSTADQE